MSNPPHMVQLIDLKRHHIGPNGEVFYDQKEVEADFLKYVRLPFDLPCYMRVIRVTNPPRTDIAAKMYDPVAITIELDFFIIGLKLYVRVGNDGTYKIITEDSEGRELLAQYERG